MSDYLSAKLGYRTVMLGYMKEKLGCRTVMLGYRRVMSGSKTEKSDCNSAM
jgi:hypothetical protein